MDVVNHFVLTKQSPVCPPVYSHLPTKCSSTTNLPSTPIYPPFPRLPTNLLSSLGTCFWSSNASCSVIKGYVYRLSPRGQKLAKSVYKIQVCRAARSKYFKISNSNCHSPINSAYTSRSCVLQRVFYNEFC
jgi:hypothetical protein